MIKIFKEEESIEMKDERRWKKNYFIEEINQNDLMTNICKTDISSFLSKRHFQSVY